MSTIKSNAGWVIALVIAVIALFVGMGSDTVNLGAITTNSPSLGVETLAVGPGCDNEYETCTGTELDFIKAGTCSLVSDSSIAATSTGTGTCAATGVTAGDVVSVLLSTTTTKMSAQWAVVGAVAGTDSITVRLLNLTGTAAVPSATNGLGSSTQYTIHRP